MRGELPIRPNVLSSLKELGSKNGLPPYVAVPNTFPSYGAGYLGGSYNPFIAGDPNVSGYQPRDLTLPADMSALAGMGASYNQLTNLTLPAGPTNLTTLYLDRNQLSNLVLPAGVTNLTSLFLGGTLHPEH